MQHWIWLSSLSATAKLRWKERTGGARDRTVQQAGGANVKWWIEHSPTSVTLQPFLQENEDMAPRIADHIQALLIDGDSLKKLI